MSRGRPGRQGIRVILTVLLVAALGGLEAGARASTPGSGTVTVPSVPGQTVTDSWTGDIPALANATSNCGPLADTPAVDQHLVTVNVPAGTYGKVQATFTFNISWGDGSNDEILTVLAPDGTSIGSSDGGSPSETVTGSNLSAGTYKVIACGFLSGPDSQPYNGQLTVETLAIEPPPSPGSTRGITFDHASWNDPVRMVGEPDIVIDHDGGIYASGPGGSTTQASWFWKSEDKGIQWHLVGCPVKSNCQNGGGDTEITIGNNNDVFASDLQTLTCNSTFRSYDAGTTWTPGEACFPGTDRQWMGIYDPNGGATGRRIYLSANQLLLGCYVIVSTDNGVTYVPAAGDGLLPDGQDCIGRLAVDPSNGDVFVPTANGVYRSSDGGATWELRGSNGAQGNFFANLAIDTAGNLWQGWTEGDSAFVSYSTDDGATWTTHQVSTGPGSPVGTNPDLRQMLFPWTVVGDPGRVAIVYYATTDSGSTGGFPGSPKALWNVYASISTNAMDSSPTWTQVQVTEHPMHRGAVCTGGFPGCLTANSDRSMADFFAVDKDPEGRIYIAYNENSDLSLVVPEPAEYIGKPINAVIRLRTGPSLFASVGNLLPDPAPAAVAITSASSNGGTLTVNGTHGLPPGNWSSDPAGDAPFPVVPVRSANHPALDIREVSAADDGTNLTITLDMADLSSAALADALSTGGIPTWMAVWWQGNGGLGPTTMAQPFHSHWYVKWRGGTEFEYGRVGSIDAPALGAPTPKALTYMPSGAATGSVNGNRVTISVPLASLGGLAAGDKIDHVLGYTLAEHADVTVNDWVDQAKSFSYQIGTPAASQHQSDGYVEVSLDPNFGSPTRATLSPTDHTWTASITGAPGGGTVYARQVLSNDLHTPEWDDVQVGPVAQATYGADLVTAMSADRSVAHVKQPVTYTITVTNRGPSAATGVKVTDTFSKTAAFVSVTGTQGSWSCSVNKPKRLITCTLSGSLAVNGVATVKVVLNPSQKGTLTNTATTTLTSPGDPNAGNNAASISMPIT